VHGAPRRTGSFLAAGTTTTTASRAGAARTQATVRRGQPPGRTANIKNTATSEHANRYRVYDVGSLASRRRLGGI
jgi:hypothetical protein